MHQCRGIRGAITVEANTREAILAGTHMLLSAMIEANHFVPEDIACAFFTTTVDLNAEFPAIAARALGWGDVPLLCGHEMAVPHGLARCVRVLLLWNTERAADEVRHVYLREAANLRPDLVTANALMPGHLQLVAGEE